MRFLGAVLLLGSAAQAMNLPQVTPLGFSGDGSHYAFESHWVADGSGFPFRELHVVNVPRNTYVARLRLGGEGWEGRERALDARYVGERDEILRRYRVSGRQLGAVLHHEPLHLPLSYAARPDERDLRLEWKGEWIHVRLDEVNVPGECRYPALLPEGETRSGLRLAVEGRVLQLDRRVPAWRSCGYAFHVEEVRVWNDRVAVTLRAFMPGFEGPDASPLVVTGRWEE